ncbi:MAG: VanZ family protein [Nitrospiraceae bacterium]|nr:VanZ family protein [Nitrospiraceae bacterium]
MPVLSRRRLSLRVWWPVFLWMAVIFIFSSDLFSASHTSSVIEPVVYALFPGIHQETVETVHEGTRKAGHVIEYLLLGLLLFRALRADSDLKWRYRWAVWTLLLVTGYAASDEFHQSFVASRTSSAFDVLIDAAGGLLAVIVMRIAALKSQWRR